MDHPTLSKDKRYTYADYQAWPDEERWELIDGVAYNMTPAPNTRHQKISSALHGIIWSFLRGKTCQVFPAPFDVRLPKANQSEKESDTVVQPDLSVFCDPKKIDEKGAIGAPDWVIEVLSPSTLKKDVGVKTLLYQAHGVAEYWLVDPEAETISVLRFDPGLKRYGLGQEFTREHSVAPAQFPGLSIALEEVFG